MVTKEETEKVIVFFSKAQGSKFKKAIKNPGKILPHVISSLKRRFQKLQVKIVQKKGEVFYRYKGVLYPEYLFQGNAISFILEKVQKYCQGRGIDVGAGKWPLRGATPIENEEFQNAYKLDNFSDGSLDYVFSSHCLEHPKNWQDALALWLRKLKTNGILFLYLPHESMRLWNPGSPLVFDGHKWIPTFEIINSFLKDNGMEIIEYNPGRDAYWSFHMVARKIKK